MQTVYKVAERVVVWLGEASKDTQEAFELLAHMTAVVNEESQISAVPGKDKTFTGQDLKDRGVPEPTHDAWQALDAIYWREWWTRAWIIQEVAFATEIEVLCGSERCSWQALVACSQFIIRHSMNAITRLDPQRAVQLSDFNNRIRGRSVVSQGSDTQLLQLLFQARTSYATDGRDKLYAILGIASNAVNPVLRPDYHKPVVDVYTSVASYFIDRDRNLDILSFVEDHRFRRKDDLPLWVPDWEVHPPVFPFYTHPQWTRMRATGTTTAMCSFSPDKKFLTVRGQEIDIVEHSGACFLEFVPLPGSVKTRTPGYQEMFDFLMLHRRWQWQKLATKLKTYPTGESIMSAYSKTLVAGMPMDDPEEHHRTWLRFWETAALQGGRFISIAHAELSEEELSRANEYMSSQHRAAFGRRFFTTKKGYMGLGPSLGLRGCIVVLLHGGRTPYIFRMKGASYEFVEECYVQGLMNGEGLAGVEVQKDFVIK